jgi:hypothetical protein
MIAATARVSVGVQAGGTGHIALEFTAFSRTSWIIAGIVPMSWLNQCRAGTAVPLSSFR